MRQINFTQHALDRCKTRGLPAENIARVVASKLRETVRDAAVLVAELDRKVTLNDGSNGDEVWAIIRDGLIATVMLRRKSQRDTVRNLGVAAVIL